MSNWIMKLYDLYFQEFVEYMHDQLLKCEYINADETKLEVLELKKSEGNRTVRCGCIKQEEAKKRRWCSISLKRQKI